jgi:hypothetical protein
MDTQIEEGVFDTLKRSQQRKRNLYQRGCLFDELEVIGFLAMLVHGGSFVVW